MNKSEFIAAVCEASKDEGISKAAVKRIVESGLDIVAASIESGEGIQIAGFGSIGVVKKAARKGVNPQTGKKITIKARNAVKFKAGKALKDAAAKAKLK